MMTNGGRFRVLSFGGGVQSNALLARLLEDGLANSRDTEPEWRDLGNEVLQAFGGPIDLVCVADTQAEHASFYRAVETARMLCASLNVPFELVTAGNLARPVPARTGTQGIFVPVFTVKLVTDEDGPVGTHGQMMRQCTSRYKIEPVEAAARKYAGDRPLEVILAISRDELERMRFVPDDEPIRYAYPLVLGNDLVSMNRSECVQLLHEYEIEAAKSACVFCPYKTDARWIAMYENEPDAFAQAVDYDRWVRTQRPNYLCYVHRSRRPLEDIVPELAAAARAQGSLFDLTTSDFTGCESGFCGT